MENPLAELRLRAQAQQAFSAIASWEEARVRRLLSRMAQELERPFYTWTRTTGLNGPDGAIPDTLDPLKAATHLGSMEGPALVLFHDANTSMEDPTFRRMLRDLSVHLSAAHRHLVFLAPDPVVPQDLEKDIDVIELPLPDPAERETLVAQWKDRLHADLAPSLGELAITSAGLTETEIHGALGRMAAARITTGTEALDFLAREKRKLIRRARFLDLLDRDVSFDDVGGLTALKEWLTQRQAAFTPEARAFGLPEPKGLLLIGVQGCGKSLTAKAIAELWGVPLLRLDAGSVLGVERGEARMRESMRVAEAMAPAILWIDEIDKAFGKMQGGAAMRIFGSFITWLQEKSQPVFVVATANQVSNLPPELLRKGRFDEIFFVDLPDIHDRAAILRIHLTARGRNPESFDTWTLAEMTDKFSGAELEQLVIDSLFTAFDKGRDLMDDDLQFEARESVPLAITMDKYIKELRTWARDRTRAAAQDLKRIDFFARWGDLMDEAGGSES